MNHVSLVIDSRPENVPLVGACVKELAVNFFTEVKIAEVEQALVETVNNCIEHAYGGSEIHQIIIDYTLSSDCLIVEVTDQGKPLDVERVKNLTEGFNYDPFDIDNLPEGGFGLKVIKNCIDEVDYRRVDGKNCWSLTKYR